MLDVARDRETLLYLHHNLGGVIGNNMGFLFGMLRKFDEYPRVYHSSDHILDLCNKIIADKHPKEIERKLLFLALYHDYYYDPKSSQNEKLSAEKLLEDANDLGLDSKDANEIYFAILDTKGHNKFSSELSKQFCMYDLSGFGQGEFRVLQDEMKIRKEYAFADWKLYREEKLKFLRDYREKSLISEVPVYQEGVDFLLRYIGKEVPQNYAVYAGSFNPFHVGHKNIIEKAEKIFDKVITAVGYNPEKKIFREASMFPKFFDYRQIDKYDTSLPAYLKSKSYPLTVIRGIRDTTDLQAEIKQLRWLQAIDKNINVVYIIGDREYSHISSSDIRNVQSFDDIKGVAEKYEL